MKEDQKIGTELVTQGIDTLSQVAINRVVPANAVHNVSNVVREGAHRAVDQLVSAADKQISKLATKPSRKRRRPSKRRSKKLPPKRVKYLQNDIEES